MSNVKGVGIDLVSIQEIMELDQRTKGSFFERTFGQTEKQEAEHTFNKYEYLAGRFAVKEAVYKAICSLDTEINFDFRIVETVRQKNGAPRVQITDELQAVMHTAHVNQILVSITNQGDLVLAIAEITE